MKLRATVLDKAPVTARGEREEYAELHAMIRNAPNEVWVKLDGFETTNEVKKVVRHLRNGRNSMQAAYRKRGITLEIHTDKDISVVFFCKTARRALPEEHPVDLPF